jgi:glucosamine--fructose-6-phosphate aminotransferase (isomerizing)
MTTPNNESYLEKIGIDGEIVKAFAIQENLENQELQDIFILLENRLKENPNHYTIGLGHTRWATHGMKTDYNSHPHISMNNKFVLVHNGIISNYEELKAKYLSDYLFKSHTDSEVIVNMIQYLTDRNPNITEILKQLSDILIGTWSCIIYHVDEPYRLYFIKNENPLLIGFHPEMTLFTSEPSGFMNMVDKYILLRDKTYGYVEYENKSHYQIFGNYNEIDLIKSVDEDIKLSPNYPNWMYKEIMDQSKLNILYDPLTMKSRYENQNILFDFDFIKSCKYLYIIGCGSSYYAGLIASNYFRFTKAFEFVNVFDGGEFTEAHLESIENPEKDLLVIMISQSGETRDINIATSICRKYSKNRRTNESHIENDYENEIKIIGIINVVGSLISRRTIDNIYTNCGRENSVASTKTCTSQILACLLLSIYKSELNRKLPVSLKEKFFSDLDKLHDDINLLYELEKKIQTIARTILSKNKKSMFLLGNDELHGVALEGALKIKEIAYIHAEGFNITALKHGPYAMIEDDIPIIVIYKERNHFIKSIIEEVRTRGAFIIEISSYTEEENGIKIPLNRTFTGLLSVICLQLLSYHLSILQNINPDRPRHLAKVVTTD